MSNNVTHGKIDEIGSFVGTKSSSSSTIRDLLAGKGNTVHTIPTHASVLDALKRMAEHRVGALVVVEGVSVVGVISERDYARKVVLIGKSSAETTVQDVMGQPVRTITREHTIGECMSLMTEHHIRHLPVMDEGRLAGIVSIGDLVKTIISDQERRIEQFERYIRGTYPV